MTDLKAFAETEAKRIKLELEELQTVIDRSPPGHLKCSTRGDGRKCYYVVSTENGKRRARYIDLKHRELAEQLAMRDFCIRKRRILAGNLRCLEAVLKGYSGYKEKDFEMMMNPDHFELIRDEVYRTDAEVREWMAADVKRNPKSTGSLNQRTMCGLRVRSKSEAMIADQLHNSGIPFRYEAVLNVNGQDYYPDFTIMHPWTHDIYVWEHFGLMSSIPYRFNALKKLSAYFDSGLELGKDLIATFEWEDNPLDPNLIAMIIEHYFI